jgi:hypothetical protein
MINAPIEDANDYDVTGTECDPDYDGSEPLTPPTIIGY